MTKKLSFEERLLRSVDEAVAIHRGEAKPAREYALPMTARHAVVAEPEPIEADEIVALRKRLGDWSQAVLAKAMDVSLGTVRNWEQGVRAPEGPARRLLAIARQQPDVLRSLVGPREGVKVYTRAVATGRFTERRSGSDRRGGVTVVREAAAAAMKREGGGVKTKKAPNAAGRMAAKKNHPAGRRAK